jgi:hypothetical protein
MREAVQLDGAAVVVVDLAEVAVDRARTAGACNRAMEAQKGAVFMVASVVEEMELL